MPWRGPAYPGELPTLGYYAIDWIEENLADPSAGDGSPMRVTSDQAQFWLNFYAIDPKTGRRKYRRGAISRSKGWGKSPVLAAFLALEGLADVVPDGWDANGEPVGKPWRDVRPVLVQAAAYSLEQVANSWDPLQVMLGEGAAAKNYRGLEVLQGFINLPKRGRIEPVTAAAASREGNPVVASTLDQTESWTPSNGGTALANTQRRNVGKTNGTTLEAPNAFVPGVNSVAERTAAAAAAIASGRSKATGILYDHREAPADTDMTNRESLLAGLRWAYFGPYEPLPWVDLDRFVEEAWDPDTDPQDARRYYLNQVTHASDSWISSPEWRARARASWSVKDGETITLGFDGSRRRSRGVTDATALIGCRVRDGHLFQIRVWEQPPNWPVDGEDWKVPTVEVDAVVRDTFKRYNVVGFYADPAKWESNIASWEAAYNARLKVKATRNNPIEWWMTGGRNTLVVRALESFHDALIYGELTHDGASILTQHALNARRRPTRSGLQIAKEHPDSPNKIDAVVAAVLAWTCRLDALAAGLGTTPNGLLPMRLR